MKNVALKGRLNVKQTFCCTPKSRRVERRSDCRDRAKKSTLLIGWLRCPQGADNATVGTLIMAAGPGLFGLAHGLSGSYATSLCLCIGLQLASSLIILCAPRVVREPVSATEGG